MLAFCLLSLLFVGAYTQASYQVLSTWENFGQDDCTGLLLQSIGQINGACTPIACSCPSDATYCFQTECAQESPFPYGLPPVSLVQYNGTECDGTIIFASGAYVDVCLPGSTVGAGTNSITLNCTDPDNLAFIEWENDNCTGTSDNVVLPLADLFNGTCIATGVIANPFGSETSTRGAVCICFHEDTVINYQGNDFSLAALQTSQQCAIPHIVKANGVKISTTCPGQLRLTDEHLVFTQDGLKKAAAVKVGDFLYSDMEQKNTCEVTKVETEIDQNYFGLNCEDSEVLASGYKTSTFGITHDIPAAWMKYASKVVGVHTASAIGDAVAKFLFQVNLL
jgi:hypothetical protein